MHCYSFKLIKLMSNGNILGIFYGLVITRNQIARSISSYKSVQRKTEEFHEKSIQTGMRMKSEIKLIYSKNETNSCKGFTNYRFY